jgi:glycosyltransferase involved in cell wall biosynthesis
LLPAPNSCLPNVTSLGAAVGDARNVVESLTGLKEVVWIAQTPTPYNNFLFEQLHRTLAGNFTVYFVSPGSADAPWKSLAISPWMKFFQARCAVDWEIVRTVARKRDALLVVGGWNVPTNRLLLHWYMLTGRPYVLWTDTPQQNPGWKHKLRNCLLRPIFRQAHAVMGTGKMATTRLREMGAPAQRIVNFPYWTPLPNETSYRTVTATPVRFACIGRLVAYKGFEYPIRALAQLPVGEAELDIIGTGPDEPRLRTMSRELGVSDRVVFRGWYEPDQVDSYLRSECGGLLHCSSQLEPYGVIILEAMAHGRPVIGSTTCAAVVDRVEHGRNGFILENPITVPTLAECMRQLTNPGRLRQMGVQARRTAEQWPVERGISIVQRLLAEVPNS